jgi:hypothetical protein
MLTRQFLLNHIRISKQTPFTISATKKQILFYHAITFHLLCNIYTIGIRVYSATWVNIPYSCHICGLAVMFQYQKYQNIWEGPRWLHRNSGEIYIERREQWLLYSLHSKVILSADTETVKICRSYTDISSSTSKTQSFPTNLQYECPSQICEWRINFRFSPFIIIVNQFYCPTNALNYIKLRG